MWFFVKIGHMQKITPCLWFDTNAEEAVAYYSSIFRGGTTHATTHYPDAGKEVHGMEPGTVLTVDFEVEGYRFLALNGGPIFKFTPAVSFFVTCTTPEEVDELYQKLEKGGTALMPLDAYPFSPRYAWVKDKYGVTWQLMYRGDHTTRGIIPSLMYAGDMAGKAEEAMNLYTSIFKDARIGTISRYGADRAPDKEGTVMYAEFVLEGQTFGAMDSAHAHDFTFNEAISLLVACKDQEEIDRLWESLSAVKESEQCGWLKDQYGVSWQIAPEGMEKFLNDPDKERANRVMAAMLKMKKVNIAELEAAANG